MENHNSFIFNGIDGRNLILIPSHFENSDCHVSNRFSLKSNGNECQIYIGKRTLSALNKYFQSVDFNSKVNFKIFKLKKGKIPGLEKKKMKSIYLHLK